MPEPRSANQTTSTVSGLLQLARNNLAAVLFGLFGLVAVVVLMMVLTQDSTPPAPNTPNVVTSDNAGEWIVDRLRVDGIDWLCFSLENNAVTSNEIAVDCEPDPNQPDN